MNTSEEIELKFLSISADKRNILKNYEDYTRFYNETSNDENNKYNILFENIKTISIYKLNTDNKDNVKYSRLEFIKDEIMKIEHSKLLKINYELEMYRYKDSLDKINKEYNEILSLRNEIIEQKRLLEEVDIRQKCNICDYKKDTFISCNNCEEPLCVDCYNIILNNTILLKCPYCRHIDLNNI